MIRNYKKSAMCMHKMLPQAEVPRKITIIREKVKFDEERTEIYNNNLEHS